VGRYGLTEQVTNNAIEIRKCIETRFLSCSRNYPLGDIVGLPVDLNLLYCVGVNYNNNIHN
jgi:hypothetical protein